MKYLKLLILLTAVLGLCALQPTAALAQGGTEIVLCLDVSGSINTAELDLEIDGLDSCLTDETIVPRDGSASVAIVIYATNPLDILPLTPITTVNLNNIIIPKLDSLRNNIASIRTNITLFRTNIAAGLLNSWAILQGGSALRQFVVLVGDGQSNEPPPAPGDSTQAACDSLALDGTTICAIAVGALTAGVTELRNCATATGGPFGEASNFMEFLPVCRECLQFIFEIILEPDVATNPVDSLHTLTATVTDVTTGSPLQGATVTFQIVGGVNANTDFGFGPGTIGSRVTDANGIATIDYTSSIAGTDTIEASFVDPGGATRTSSRVTKTWQQKLVTLEPVFASNPVDSTHELTATVTLNGVPQPGVNVDFTIIAGVNAGVLTIPSANPTSTVRVVSSIFTIKTCSSLHYIL